LATLRLKIVPRAQTTSALPNDYCAANTNGTFTVVVPLDLGNCQLRTLLEMQFANPRYPRGSPPVVAPVTEPLGATVMETVTRADDGASLSRESRAGCQHPRFTLV
jgi:hypothetical protein